MYKKEDQEFHLGPESLRCVQTSNWRCQAGSWIYESGVQGRNLGWRHTFPSSQHFLVFRAIIQDEITKGVSRDREDEGLSLLRLTSSSPYVNFVPYFECCTVLSVQTGVAEQMACSRHHAGHSLSQLLCTESRVFVKVWLYLLYQLCRLLQSANPLIYND